MEVRFWGTRGSIPTPGPGTVRYGGNTSCVEVRSAAGTLIVLDCGTGARGLGKALVAEARSPQQQRGAVLIGHTHWDHIQGLPFFEPLFRSGWHWDIYGPRGLGSSLAQTLAGQMQYQYFPVSVDELGAQVDYHDLVEGTFEIDDVVVRTRYLNHPALTLGYRVECDGAVLAYLSDHEPHDPALAAGGAVREAAEDSRHVEFLAGADVVVHDAQYLASEYGQRQGWGHSTVEYVVDAAAAGTVGRLVLFHHDPSRDDDALDAVLDLARRRAAGLGDLRVDAAHEGMRLVVESASPRPSLPRGPLAGSSPALDDLDATVVIAIADADLAAAVASAARAEQLRVHVVGDDGDEVEETGRVVVVTDLDDEGVRSLSDRIGVGTWSRAAVLGVTRKMPAAATAVLGTAIDWLVWPATVTHLRTKLRASVLRRACRWLAAPLPADEDERLSALRALAVLDTPPEERFDRLTARACELFDVPAALITLVDADRQWFKSKQGIDATETPRDQSVCAHAILEPDVLHVPDLLDDERFADSPALRGPDRPRFYAGAPLVLSDGSRVGTLCVIDRRPRLLDADQLQQLRELAHDDEREHERAT